MSSEPLPPPIPEGTLVGERYRLGRVLQAGGMGVVYEARHEVLEQRVAVKVMLREVTLDPDANERFMREARAAARLKSDHVVKVLDVGMHEGLPYLAMEFLEGSDLSAVAARGALPVPEAVSYLLQAIEAIGEAHAAGIVHRDLKPSNLFLQTRDGGAPRVKVLDFGISKVAPGAGAAVRLTNTRAMLGSPAYMSPEQVRSTKNADARSDIWALGVILWELLTGEGAFDGETIGEIFSKIREEPLAPVHSKRPEVPVALSDVVARAVERDREARFQTVAELRDALAVFDAPRLSLASLSGEHSAQSYSAPTGPLGAGRPRLPSAGDGPPRATERVVVPAGAHRADAATVQAAFADAVAAMPERPSGKGGVGAQTGATWSQPTPKRPARRVALAAALVVLAGIGAAVVVKQQGGASAVGDPDASTRAAASTGTRAGSSAPASSVSPPPVAATSASASASTSSAGSATSAALASASARASTASGSGVKGTSAPPPVGVAAGGASSQRVVRPPPVPPAQPTDTFGIP